MACTSLDSLLRPAEIIHLQGDTALCLKPTVDFKTKVPFWPRLPWPSQAKA